jgi:DNA-binding NarL/FixJ family response regulator
MPQMDGIEVAKQIHTQTGSGTSPAIILMTAFGREAMEQHIDRQHLDGFLVKPITPSHLLDSIAEAMDAIQPGTPPTTRMTPESPHTQPLKGQILLRRIMPLTSRWHVKFWSKWA